MKDNYFAGFWVKNLPHALLWPTYEEETFPSPPHKSTLPAGYSAPSYPWVSVKSSTSNSISRQCLCQSVHSPVLDINTTGPRFMGSINTVKSKTDISRFGVPCWRLLVADLRLDGHISQCSFQLKIFKPSIILRMELIKELLSLRISLILSGTC
jgi:hypothetical protein